MFEISLHCNYCGEENNIFFSQEPTDSPLCQVCRSRLFRVKPIKGFVYVLSNSLMPGVFKIGFSTREVQERIKELESTGVPAPFEIEAYFYSNTPELHEAQIHEELKEYRLPRREFFKADLDLILRVTSKHLGSEPAYTRNLVKGASVDCFGRFYHYRDHTDTCHSCIAKENCVSASSK